MSTHKVAASGGGDVTMIHHANAAGDENVNNSNIPASAKKARKALGSAKV